ncbi:MAG TPA: PaaI family thioesterase [Burkholderiales bacterium]|nr:PaaI family thioesterase [Burkholderiales bacterium]
MAGRALAASKKQLQALLDRSRFVRGYGFRVVSVSPASATIELPFRRALERPGGIVNGPALMAAADCAMWVAIKAVLGMGRDALTSELNTAFLAPAVNEPVRCTARILKLGKRSIYGVAECHSRAGKLFTHHTVTYVRLQDA